ncbi:ParA family protein [Azospirillum canadense]|uniref:ParA family protein n=1 Tax=Azospirillum canadense TaxID=403962 RepID=UPI0022278B15|nr:hypothetical protein [Azospirillum canadense]MCW2239502.1 hypothetical protein [Azospirillum canadense]
MNVIMVVNDKGGVGKSFTAQGIYLAALKRKLKLTVTEVEMGRRLGAIIPEARTVKPPVLTPEELYRNPDALFQVWDQEADRWASGEHLVDFGANVFNSFATWASRVGREYLGTGVRLTLVAVLSMEQHGLNSGLKHLYDMSTLFPEARRVAVLNPVIADFIEGDKRLASLLEKARGTGAPIEQVRVERMSAPAWGYMLNMGRVDQVLVDEAGKEALMEFLPKGAVLRSYPVLEAWLTGWVSALDQVLPVPVS